MGGAWGACGGRVAFPSLPFPCCWRCPFHGDARGHGRGGRCSQPLPFIPGSRGEERGSRCRGERGRRGGHPRGPGGALRRRRRSGLPPTPPPTLPPPAPISRQTWLLRLAFPEAVGKSRARAGRGAGGGAPRARSARSRPAGRGGGARGGGRGRAAARCPGAEREPGGSLPRRKPRIRLPLGEGTLGCSSLFAAPRARSCASTAIPPPIRWWRAFAYPPARVFSSLERASERVVGYLSYRAAFRKGLRSGRGEHVK